jgi:hypothetical protein
MAGILRDLGENVNSLGLLGHENSHATIDGLGF